MNWGYKILVVFTVFVAGILFLVYKSSNQKMDLVTTDYYEKELKYQQKIDAMGKVSQLTDTVKYALSGGQLHIEFPKDFLGKTITGDLVLYCPSDEDRDVKQAFSVLDHPVSVPVQSLKRMEYQMQLSWKVGSNTYYLEKMLQVN